MIIVKFMGGLGNQLFQYALYRKILKNREDTFADLAWHYNKSSRYWYAYQLNEFGLKIKEIKRHDYQMKDLENPQKNELHTDLNKPYVTLYRERDTYIFDNNIFNADNICLLGYWQNVNYFEDILEEIKQEVVFPKSTPEMEEIEKDIKSSNSVAIHIRRNDYEFEDFDKICPLEYYKSAIEYIKAHVANPVFYIFSNKPDWVKENLCIDINYKVVDLNDRYQGLYDMKLISECKHNIISNSTFSWWAAALNKNENKLVIAPSKWTIKKEVKEIWLKEWIKI